MAFVPTKSFVFLLIGLVALCALVIAIRFASSGADSPPSPSAVQNTNVSAAPAPVSPIKPEEPKTGEQAREAPLRTADIPRLPNDALLSLVCNSCYTPTTRNDAANRLLNSGDLLLSGKLVSMLRDKLENVAWRNYCIQFLRGCYEQEATRFGNSAGNSAPKTGGGVEGGGKSEKSVRLSNEAICAALLEASEYPEPELSSCAIWSLAQLAAPKPWASTMPGAARLNASLLAADADSRIRELALKALRDPQAHLLVRTGGAQSCARMGMIEAAPDLRQIAADPQADLSIRTVAIAGLGQIKDEAARELLTQISNDASPRLKQAAQMALKALGAPKPSSPPVP
jgi:hypothetical protein